MVLRRSALRLSRVLKLVCRVTLSPDSCVRQTETAFERRGPAMLVVEVPARHRDRRAAARRRAFASARALSVYDAAGRRRARLPASRWDSRSTAKSAGSSSGWRRLGTTAMLLVGALVAATSPIASPSAGASCALPSRISVQELYEMMSRGRRSRGARRAHGGAPAPRRQADSRGSSGRSRRAGGYARAVPRDREVVVYCACPNEATAAKVALQLRARASGACGRSVAASMPVSAGSSASASSRSHRRHLSTWVNAGFLLQHGMKVERVLFPAAQGRSTAARLDAPDEEPRAYALFAHCFTWRKGRGLPPPGSRSGLPSTGSPCCGSTLPASARAKANSNNTNFSSNVQDLVAAAAHPRQAATGPAR